MLIDSASLPSVQKGRRGVVVFIDDDALGVAKQIEAMEFPEGYGKLRLAWNEFREEFVVMQIHPDGNEYFVTSAKKADGRLVKRVQQITHPSYSLSKELEEIDNKADKEHDWLFSQKVGDLAERLHHELRKDKQIQNKVFLNWRR